MAYKTGFDYDTTRRLDSNLLPEELWRLIRQGFEDSDSSPIWPRELERVRCPELKQGAEVTARYEIIGGFGATQTYQISELEPGRRMVYRTGPDHPLDGGGEVEVRPGESGSSQLVWHFQYHVRPRPAALAGYTYVRFFFEPRFFESLERNIRNYENQPCCLDVA